MRRLLPRDMQEGVSLKEYTTFKVGGPASYFATVRSVGELTDALTFAAQHTLAWFVLGGGSNVIFSDEGYEGVVLKMEITGVAVEDRGDTVEVTCGAGESWDALVALSVERGWYGLENLSAIPGTVGAAPLQNIGAYGMEVGESISFVEVLNTETGEIETLTPAACAFGYRTSVFKTPEGAKYTVLRVGFLLKKWGELRLTYKDVTDYFKSTGVSPTLNSVRGAIGEIRAQKFPDLALYGTAGSYFKNPIIPREEGRALQARFPELPLYDVDGGHVKIALAWILDHVLHLRGLRKGRVGTFERQPLVLVNFGGATSVELHAFAECIAADVLNATGIKIVPEVVSI